MKIFVGVDESGTGAWAGPATAAAVAVLVSDTGALRTAGVKDSKALSDLKRRMLVDEILQWTLATSVVEISVEALDYDFQEAWRLAMCEAASRAAASFKNERLELVVDGNLDVRLRLRLAKQVPNAIIRFVPKADRKFPAVGAASILAKTHRNDRMLELANRYPEYAWDQNKGYHSGIHLAAILKYGITPAHRRIKPIRMLLESKQVKER